MAIIRPESSHPGFAFLKVALALASFIIVCNLAGFVGVHGEPSSVQRALVITAMIVSQFVVYGILQGITMAALRVLSYLLDGVLSLMAFVQDATERVMTWVVETSAQLSIAVITLPFKPIAFGIA